MCLHVARATPYGSSLAAPLCNHLTVQQALLSNLSFVPDTWYNLVTDGTLTLAARMQLSVAQDEHVDTGNTTGCVGIAAVAVRVAHACMQLEHDGEGLAVSSGDSQDSMEESLFAPCCEDLPLPLHSSSGLQALLLDGDAAPADAGLAQEQEPWVVAVHSGDYEVFVTQAEDMGFMGLSVRHVQQAPIGRTSRPATLQGVAALGEAAQGVAAQGVAAQDADRSVVTSPPTSVSSSQATENAVASNMVQMDVVQQAGAQGVWDQAAGPLNIDMANYDDIEDEVLFAEYEWAQQLQEYDMVQDEPGNLTPVSVEQLDPAPTGKRATTS